MVRAHPMSLSILIGYDARTASRAFAQAARLAAQAEVVLAGPGGAPEGVRHVACDGGPGERLRRGLEVARGELIALLEPGCTPALEPLLAPLREGTADATFATGPAPSPLRALATIASELALPDPFPPARAFRVEVLRALELSSEGEEIDAELLVKLGAHAYRVVPVALELDGPRPRPSWRRARALLRYATVQNALENQHEGYNTLARMEAAPNYNAWLGRQFLAHLGKRVLEIGAGIGTITRLLAPACERLVALEADPFYHRRLVNLFRGQPNVSPIHAPVERTDWDALAKEGFDTVVLSNVLEHIEDDVAAVRNFRRVLSPGGRLLVLVPALPQLFGAMDEAVGHFRRYTDAALVRALTAGGFVVESTRWMNLVGIPGWFLNGRVLKRRAVPPLQLRIYDRLAPLLAEAESKVSLPIGMSLFAVGRAT